MQGFECRYLRITCGCTVWVQDYEVLSAHSTSFTSKYLFDSQLVLELAFHVLRSVTKRQTSTNVVAFNEATKHGKGKKKRVRENERRSKYI